MMKKAQGFALVEGLLILVIVGILAGTGWFVYDSHKKTSQTLNQANNVATTGNANLKVTLKEYKNTDFGYSFQYPSNWTLTTSLSDIGRGGLEGGIFVKSPYGTQVQLGRDFGGKGGDCIDDTTNTRTTRTCSTFDVISVYKLPGSDKQPVYFYKASITPPTEDKMTKKFYFVYIGSGQYTPTTTGSTLEGLTPPYDGVVLSTGKGYVTPNVTGPDDSKNGTSAFFNTKEVQEATPILESFKFL